MMVIQFTWKTYFMSIVKSFGDLQNLPHYVWTSSCQNCSQTSSIVFSCQFRLQPFYDTSKWQQNEKLSITHYWNVSFGTPMCRLQITNWHWTTTMDSSCRKWTLYLKISQSAVTWTAVKIFKNKKSCWGEFIFTPLCQSVAQNSK